MMRIRSLLIALALVSTVVAVQAQIRIGIKGGIAVSKLHFDKRIIDSENRAGFSGGLQLELSLPITGLGIEGSLMYSHRNDALSGHDHVYRRDYIEIPVHLKYGFTLLGFNKFIVPYAFTGPNFSFLFNESKQDLWENRSSNTAWDVGAGVELLGHLQLQAAYTIGITDTFKQVGIKSTSLAGESVRGRDRCWTVTVAYLF